MTFFIQMDSDKFLKKSLSKLINKVQQVFSTSQSTFLVNTSMRKTFYKESRQQDRQDINHVCVLKFKPFFSNVTSRLL